jgi:hypothetical protein
MYHSAASVSDSFHAFIAGNCFALGWTKGHCLVWKPSRTALPDHLIFVVDLLSCGSKTQESTTWRKARFYLVTHDPLTSQARLCKADQTTGLNDIQTTVIMGRLVPPQAAYVLYSLRRFVLLLEVDVLAFPDGDWYH